MSHLNNSFPFCISHPSFATMNDGPMMRRARKNRLTWTCEKNGISTTFGDPIRAPRCPNGVPRHCLFAAFWRGPSWSLPKGRMHQQPGAAREEQQQGWAVNDGGLLSARAARCHDRTLGRHGRPQRHRRPRQDGIHHRCDYQSP